jgi:hypothetical protein
VLIITDNYCISSNYSGDGDGIVIYPKSIVGVILLVFIISTDSLSQSSGGFGWSGEASHPSLIGTVYKIPESTYEIPADPSNQIGVIHTASLDIQPEAAKNGLLGKADLYKFFAIKYDGYFRVNQEGLYKFRLVSDDGSVLYIDGNKIIDNDGLHGRKSGLGQEHLLKGAHSISVDYFQAGGKAALQLFWIPPGGSEKIFKPEWVTKNDMKKEILKWRKASRFFMEGKRLTARGKITEAEAAFAKAKELGYTGGPYPNRF